MEGRFGEMQLNRLRVALSRPACDGALCDGVDELDADKIVNALREIAGVTASFSSQCLMDVSNLGKDLPLAVAPPEDLEWTAEGSTDSASGERKSLVQLESRATFLEATAALKEMAEKPHLQILKIARHWEDMMAEFGDEQMAALMRSADQADQVGRTGRTGQAGQDDVGVKPEAVVEAKLAADVATFVKDCQDAIRVFDTYISRAEPEASFFVGLAEAASRNLRTILANMESVDDFKKFASESRAAKRRKHPFFMRIMDIGTRNINNKKRKRLTDGRENRAPRIVLQDVAKHLHQISE